jgi:putative spermidine/putrescine transport system substrate-binding protein
MIRKTLLGALILLLAGFAALYWYMRPLPILTVTTWPGDYGHAQQVGQMHPYASAKRVDVHIAEWEGRLNDLKGDVIDFELPRAVEACARGMLEKIDPATLPAGDDGTEAAKDFVPGAIGPCWIGSVVYSQVVIFAPNAFPNGGPATLADFFDTTKFPGKRALKRGSGKYNLEMALLADGVSPGEVYATLATDAGITRALAKIASLGPNLTWYDKDSEALARIRDGEAAFATALNGQLYDPKASSDQIKPGVIWDRQLYELDAFGIPAGNPRKEMALDFIRYATGSKATAAVSSLQPFGPARRSGWPLVVRNPENGADLRPILPTAHFDTAFAVDDGWWRTHTDAIDAVWRSFTGTH